MNEAESQALNALTEQIIGAAIEVHRELGPGLLESAYEACLVYELRERGIQVESQKDMGSRYKNLVVDCGYKLDLLVQGKIIVELKAVDTLNRVHDAQVLTYLKLSGCRLGLLINFNVTLLKNGIKRLILDLR